MLLRRIQRGAVDALLCVLNWELKQRRSFRSCSSVVVVVTADSYGSCDTMSWPRSRWEFS